MKRLLLILLAPPLLLACGKTDPDATPVLAKALAAVGGADSIAGVKSLYLRLEGDFLPPTPPDTRIPYTQEILLTLPDRLAVRVDVAGIVTTRGVAGDKVWIRSGAAVDDRTGPAAVEEIADRDDLLSLLVAPLLDPAFSVRRTRDGVIATRTGGPDRNLFFDPDTGLPVRLVRAAQGARGNTGQLVRTFSDWTEHAGLRFPSKFTVKLGGGRLELTAKTVEFNTRDSRGLTHRRPVDRREFRMGEIRQVKEPGGNYFVVRQQGTYLNLAKLDVLIEQGFDASYARRRGPNRRVFDHFPDEKGIAVVGTIVPVTFDRDPRARHLPQGIEVKTFKAGEALAMKFTGPYPLDDSLEKILVNYGKDLGLTKNGVARYLVLSDPEIGEPADLSQEIRLPVRKAE